jgi:hypothetical protein
MDPDLSGCQGRETPTPRQVAHPGPNPAEVSSPDGGTQRNGDHCFLRGRIDPGGYWWPPTYSNWLLVSIFVQHVLLYYFVIVGSTLMGLYEAPHILQVDTGGLS